MMWLFRALVWILCASIQIWIVAGLTGYLIALAYNLIKKPSVQHPLYLARLTTTSLLGVLAEIGCSITLGVLTLWFVIENLGVK